MDRDGTLWIGTFGGGLNSLDPSTGHIRWYQNRPGDAQSLSGTSVRAIYQDTKEGSGLARRGGLNLFDKQSGGFRH